MEKNNEKQVDKDIHLILRKFKLAYDKYEYFYFLYKVFYVNDKAYVNRLLSTA